MVLRSGFFATGDDRYMEGGNDLMATAYLARWSGPVPEAADAYGDHRTPSGVSAVRHVQDVLMLLPRSGPLDNDALKTAVMTHGAVSTNMFYQDDYLNAAGCYYLPEGGWWQNHGIAIVGWDDAFSATNFGDSAKGLPSPPGDGAFIVRNSWSKKWGSGGYFRVSYYDARFARGFDLSGNPQMSAVYCAAQPLSTYHDIYQYDRLGWTTDFGYGGDTAWFANRFSARADARLAAVSFYSAAPGSSYEVFAGPSLSRLRSCSTGPLEQVGYHTVKLGLARRVSEGRPFVVAVKLTTPRCDYPVPVEMPLDNAGRATAAARQSYVSPDGSTWTDLTVLYPDTNVCLKAFTRAL